MRVWREMVHGGCVAILGFGWLLAGGGAAAADATAPVAGSTGLRSGIDLRYVDPAIRPQDDLYRHVNGKWLAETQIPADKGYYDMFEYLADRTEQQLHGIVDALRGAAATSDPDGRKIADLYASFMDEATVERRGLAPLAAEFGRIEAVHSASQVPALIARLQRIGVPVPFTPQVHQDAKDSSKYVFDLGQDGLGMPDRDYYLSDAAELAKIRAAYAAHVERMLTLAHEPRPHAEARQIVALERALAESQWTKVELRDPVKAYNKYEFDRLAQLAPHFDWNAYLAAAGVTGKTDYVIVGQPSYITAFAKLLATTPLPTWRAYFRWHLLNSYAPYLGKTYEDEHFAFYGTALQGIQRNRERWKRGLALVDASIGEGLGRLYVAEYFPASSKTRMEQLVQNLLAAYRADIETLDWMGPETRRHAQEKLAKIQVKIGYPSHWRDYGSLVITRDDLFGNVARAREFEYQRNVDKLGRPLDRSEWGMTPQEINAYYNPELNEIVFPAAILQPPFFDASADDAVNYGGIGAVIGHEISHGFDDQGSQYDGDGNLLAPPGWFTQADLDRFKQKAHALVAQYAAYSPLAGYPINGELTLGENIADNSGLAIAFKAYRLSLGGHEAPVIDGLTGAQRFFCGFAQVWRGKMRDNMLIMELKTDPHSPDEIRGLVPERNQAAFYDAFGVKPGDKMYLPPESRVTMW